MIKLIVGLGNPGARYQKTRHNAGFWLLDQLAAAEGGRLAEDKKFQGEYGKIALAYQPVHLLKPLTFMNASGRAVSALAKFYDLAPEEILVVHDELDIPCGRIKFKLGGGNGGHNGLKDIQARLGTADYYRLPAACTESAADSTAQRFQAAYRAKNYAQAARIQQQYVNACNRFMVITEQMRARNDLAVAYKNSGNKTACRAALQPLRRYWNDKAEEHGYHYRDDFMKELAAAKFNWNACR